MTKSSASHTLRCPALVSSWIRGSSRFSTAITFLPHNAPSGPPGPYSLSRLGAIILARDTVFVMVILSLAWGVLNPRASTFSGWIRQDRVLSLRQLGGTRSVTIPEIGSRAASFCHWLQGHLSGRNVISSSVPQSVADRVGFALRYPLNISGFWTDLTR